ncbi:helix-turn-helix domain-containing protein [Streptomyces sp. NPDC093795]|uniref:helix-turn-helix domain-containing protein n=1 Tax=Streptomyces sp. NPDC093795 TaxID=3366051 RepID=UPI003828810E
MRGTAVGQLTGLQAPLRAGVMQCWSFNPSSVVPPLTRPQLAEARRVRAAELFEQGRSGAEIARMLDVSEESVRRWKHATRNCPGPSSPTRAWPSTRQPHETNEKISRACCESRSFFVTITFWREGMTNRQ